MQKIPDVAVNQHYTSPEGLACSTFFRHIPRRGMDDVKTLHKA
jgi:hypothetical protein